MKHNCPAQTSRLTFTPMNASIPFRTPSPLQRLSHDHLDLWIKRDDLIHPIVSGNKWRKLKGFFDRMDPLQPVVTFGGAFSNHLPAAAFACQFYGVRVVGVVRGDELHPQSNSYLRYCQATDMELHFVSRSEFRALRNRAWHPTEQQLEMWGLPSKVQVLPEGGAGKHSVAGCGEIWQEIQAVCAPEHLVLASGTSATVQGILSAMPWGCSTKVHVLSAVRGAKKEQEATEHLARDMHITLAWHDEPFGGFGKSTPELEQTAQEFESIHSIPLDPNYNSKVWHWLSGARLSGQVVWVHTGGFRPPATL